MRLYNLQLIMFSNIFVYRIEINNAEKVTDKEIGWSKHANKFRTDT